MLSSFARDVKLWNSLSSNFPYIEVVYECDDINDWHVTIRRNDIHGKEYKFHFVVFWNQKFYSKKQPKILLTFDQRCMVNSKNFFGNWVALDKNITTFTITSVLISLNNIVREINIENVDHQVFNSVPCCHCLFGNLYNNNNQNKDSTKEVPTNNSLDLEIDITSSFSFLPEKDNDSINGKDSIITESSVCNSSVKSLTLSTTSLVNNEKDNIDTNSQINIEIKDIVSKDKLKKPISEPILNTNTNLSKSKKIIKSIPKKVNKKPIVNKLKNQKNIKNTISKKSKSATIKNPNINSKSRDISNNSVTYMVQDHLEVDSNGILKWVYKPVNYKINLKSNGRGWKIPNRKN